MVIDENLCGVTRNRNNVKFVISCSFNLQLYFQMHFEPSQFVNFTKKKLKADAVLTIFSFKRKQLLTIQWRIKCFNCEFFRFSKYVAYECQSVKRITSCKHYQCSNNLKSKLTVAANSFKLAELVKANTTLLITFEPNLG